MSEVKSSAHLPASKGIELTELRLTGFGSDLSQCSLSARIVQAPKGGYTAVRPQQTPLEQQLQLTPPRGADTAT